MPKSVEEKCIKEAYKDAIKAACAQYALAIDISRVGADAGKMPDADCSGDPLERLRNAFIVAKQVKADALRLVHSEKIFLT